MLISAFPGVAKLLSCSGLLVKDGRGLGRQCKRRFKHTNIEYLRTIHDRIIESFVKFFGKNNCPYDVELYRACTLAVCLHFSYHSGRQALNSMSNNLNNFEKPRNFGTMKTVQQENHLTDKLALLKLFHYSFRLRYAR